MPATVTSGVVTLEFVAATARGLKAYESALTVDTSATAFNAAMLMLGVDPAHARVPTRHFDPIPPAGDPVEIFVVPSRADARPVRIEQLLFDKRTGSTLPPGPWVYTGSTFSRGQYMAEVDGVLIGFVHSPSPVIENPRAGAVNAYGDIIANGTRVGLPGGAAVTLVVRALPPEKRQ